MSRAPAHPIDRTSRKRLRCAIYTRVSTDHGLDQDFNSLDAQREAAEAYIKSQAHEGWSLIKTAYDDDGVSGGSIERPAVQRLLADIRLGAIDIVVVYKVDRLTRSLADFAKLVELPRRDASDPHSVHSVGTTLAGRDHPGHRLRPRRHRGARAVQPASGGHDDLAGVHLTRSGQGRHRGQAAPRDRVHPLDRPTDGVVMAEGDARPLIGTLRQQDRRFATASTIAET